MKNYYFCTLLNKDTEKYEFLFCDNDDFIKLVVNLDFDRYRLSEIEVYDRPVSHDVYDYVKKDPNLELGKK